MYDEVTTYADTRYDDTGYAEPRVQCRPEPSERRTAAGWQTPDFTVVDTALEVTAYSLRGK
ncbi:pyrroloquinoline quinone precursor peptide PqqA [Streptomyces ziwulingensis]|uniref:Coenzyme PQQ synthesis protein A n=1 Tax=Streptomyces ziwulingensis TaxID=1045501 RepID=A0ABP9CLB9_9ACTN